MKFPRTMNILNIVLLSDFIAHSMILEENFRLSKRQAKRIKLNYETEEISLKTIHNHVDLNDPPAIQTL